MIIFICLISLNIFAQRVTTNNKLIIKHGDIVLYLTKDTCTMLSKHTLTYDKFLKLNTVTRSNKWFDDTYKGKYLKKYYANNDYDLGHLTPSHITTYDRITNDKSFSMFNASPQLHKFNIQSWNNLEEKVENIIRENESKSIIITGVIYSPYKKFLPNSRIPIPTYYFKVLYVNKKVFAWIGDNATGFIKTTTINDLNVLFKQYKQGLKIY